MHDFQYKTPKGARRKYAQVFYALIFAVSFSCGFLLFNAVYKAGASKPQPAASAGDGESKSIQQSLQEEYQSKPHVTPVPHALNLNAYKIFLSDTDELRERGLGGRAGLGQKEAMLFVFDEDSKHFFWMKDMQFSIDMVWLDKDKKVIYIARDVAPDTYPEAFGPKEDSRYVLEFSAGTAARENLQIGGQVAF